MSKRRLVVDSSVIVKWLVSDKEQWLDKADKLMRDVEKGRAIVVSPEMARYEVMNAVRFKSLSTLEKTECVGRFYRLPITYYSTSDRNGEVAMVMADDYDITYYDAVFLELAERLHSPLVTANVKHQGRVDRVEVVALKDY